MTGAELEDQSTPLGPLHSFLLLQRLGLARHNFDLVCIYGVGAVELEFDVLNDKGPYFIAEAICIEVALHSEQNLSIAINACFSWRRQTLKVILDFTRSPNTDAMLWSKLDMMRMANCGSIRRLLIRSSRVSARARPILHVQKISEYGQACDIGWAEAVRCASIELIEALLIVRHCCPHSTLVISE